MFQEVARRQLERRNLVGPVLGVAAQGLVLGGVALAVTRGLDLELSGAWVGAAGLGAAGLLEVGVQRTRRARLGPVRALLGELVEAVGEAGEPQVKWSLGLPRLEVKAAAPWVVHFESVGARLRVALSLATPTRASAWLLSRQPEDFPHRLVARLGRRLAPLSVQSPTLCALSSDGDAAEAWLAQPGLLAELVGLLEAHAPRAASLEVGRGEVRFDVALHPGITPAGCLALVARLPELVAPAEPESHTEPS